METWASIFTRSHVRHLVTYSTIFLFILAYDSRKSRYIFALLGCITKGLSWALRKTIPFKIALSRIQSRFRTHRQSFASMLKFSLSLFRASLIFFVNLASTGCSSLIWSSYIGLTSNLSNRLLSLQILTWKNIALNSMSNF